MGPKSKAQQLADGILRQHLGLSVAAHLARTELMPEARAVYDCEHQGELINIIARALAKVVPVYVHDASADARRELSAAELEGAVIMHAATLVLLKDGRTFFSASIKRSDLRQAIAVLKAVGIEELTPPHEPSRSEACRPAAEMRSRVAEIEALLRAPLLPDQVERANRLLVATARQAQEGHIANLAMQLMSALQEAKGTDESLAALHAALVRLRTAVDKSQGG
jgi:hypothetical protein